MDPFMEGLSPFNEYELFNRRSFSANPSHDAIGGINGADLTAANREFGNTTSFFRSSDADFTEESDFSDAVLRYINEVLMGDGLEYGACTIQHSTLHVTEKSFFDVLNTKQPLSPPSVNQSLQRSLDASISDSLSYSFDLAEARITDNFSNSVPALNYPVNRKFLKNSSPNSPLRRPSGTVDSGITYPVENKGCEGKPKAGRENPRDDSTDLEEGRRKKHVPVHAEESILHDLLESMLHFVGEEDESNPSSKELKERATCSKKRANRKDAFDMKSLLLQCMDSVASSDHETAQEQLNQIKKLSSPWGNSFQRLGHCFAKGLEARLAGTGSILYKDLAVKNKSSSNALKAYRLFLSTIPFMNAGNYFESKTILRLAEGSTKIHIIKFGIRQGVHMIPLIQHLAARPGGPPRLRITGIDFPQAGIRPAAMVEETGRRLANYCKSFNMPFEYHPISKEWEKVTPEDVKIEEDEVVVVMCLYQLHLLLDDTIVADSPRDAVLSLIRSINPDIFIHGVSNAPYNSPFFVSRFREALFHFSAMFDMFEATMPGDDMARMVFETEICGRDILNIIACEGVERVERPETYKKWQTRTLRAGFRQLALDQEIVKKVKAKVKSYYHKDFFVDEASQWMVQGWKGRVFCALSCWKSA